MNNLAVSVNPSRSDGEYRGNPHRGVRRDYTRGPALTLSGRCSRLTVAGEDIVRPVAMEKLQSQAEMTWPLVPHGRGVTVSADDFAFGSDLVTFRAILRGDGTLVDRTGAIKVYAGASA